MTSPDDPTRSIAKNMALVAVAGIGMGRGAYQVLMQQAAIARRVIPKPTTRPFDGDGLYRPGAVEGVPWRPGLHCDVHMMIFGDSIAAGLGADTVGQQPGVLLARGLAEETGWDVRLSVKAIVGATSVGLAGQVDAMLVAGGAPDVSIILIGGNDITARNAIGASAKRVGDAVTQLIEAGSAVVVGTCPDLGTIKPVPQPLRSVMHTLSLRLAAAQAAQVRRAGGIPVSLAETLAPEFHKRGDSLFSADRFHPNAEGYELAAGLLFPAVCTALQVWEDGGRVADVVDEGDVVDPDDVVSETEAEATGDAEAPDEPAAEAVAVPARDRVVARLVGRLTDFVRTHEDQGGTGSDTGRHNGDVDSAAEDPADARRAADLLRRRSRSLRRGDEVDGGST